MLSVLFYFTFHQQTPNPLFVSITLVKWHAAFCARKATSAIVLFFCFRIAFCMKNISDTHIPPVAIQWFQYMCQ